MIDFDYVAPASVEEAIGLLQQSNGDAKCLAGGTDILVQLREGLRSARLVVDIKKIAELTSYSFGSNGELLLGASVPCYRIYDDERIATSYPGLVDAVRIIGGWQIQSRATVGGNLCNSSPAADSIPILIALSATCQLAGPKGRRSVPVEQFCTAPGRNVLASGELLVSISFPAPSPNSGSNYLRFIPRNEMDIAVVGVGAWLKLDEKQKTIASARIGLGAVAPTPLFAQEASQWLIGKEPTEQNFAQAGELAQKIAKPISDMRGPAEYRTHLVGVLTRRSLTTACNRALAAPHLSSVYTPFGTAQWPSR